MTNDRVGMTNDNDRMIEAYLMLGVQWIFIQKNFPILSINFNNKHRNFC